MGISKFKPAPSGTPMDPGMGSNVPGNMPNPHTHTSGTPLSEEMWKTPQQAAIEKALCKPMCPPKK